MSYSNTYLFRDGEWLLDRFDLPRSFKPVNKLYLNSRTVISKEGHSFTLNGIPIPDEDIVRNLLPEVKLSLKGIEYLGDGIRLLRLTDPWTVAVLESEEEIPDLGPLTVGLPEYFYRKRIGIFGGPGSGKTCLARELTNRLCIDYGIKADNCYEYASTFITKYGRPTFNDQIWIMLKQWQREDELSRHKQVLVSDCPHPICYIYSRDLAAKEGLGCSKSLPWLFEMALKGLESFDVKIFLPNCRSEDDGVRIHTQAEAEQISKKIRAFLDESGQEYIVYEDGDMTKLIKSVLNLNG